MAVAIEGTPNAVSYVYIVGGEDYVFRECKRKLLRMGVNVSGHASYRWKTPSFEIPKLTTAILVVSDECRKDLRTCAQEQGKRWEIPVVEAPAREHWDLAEKALREKGVIDGGGAVVPLNPAAARTTLGEALAAKGEKLEMPPPAPPTNKASHVELAKQLLRESKGEVGDTPISKIITRQTGVECSIYLVRKTRRAEKIPPARPGALGPEQVAFFKKHGLDFKQAQQIPAGEGAKAPRPALKPTQPRTKPMKATTPDAVVEDEVEVFRAAVRHLDEHLVQKLHLTSLTLRLENGKWQEPEYERVQVTRGKVKLK